jgi:hypothetical protein
MHKPSANREFSDSSKELILTLCCCPGQHGAMHADSLTREGSDGSKEGSDSSKN